MRFQIKHQEEKIRNGSNRKLNTLVRLQAEGVIGSEQQQQRFPW
ncbi:hypothetical protein [Anaerobacillus sp. CMMVII]|nr:hypothetical protein [Anaerobacillus sp. CMMVII]